MIWFIVGAVVFSLAGMFWLAAIAPLGWEDENGWHEGECDC